MFGHFARQALSNSQFAIELPPAVSVFDIYPQPENGSLQPFDGWYLPSRVKGIPTSFTVLPQVRADPVVHGGGRKVVSLAGSC